MRRYIFNSEGGQDRSGKSEKISMTSPVKAEMLDGGYKVRALTTVSESVNMRCLEIAHYPDALEP